MRCDLEVEEWKMAAKYLGGASVVGMEIYHPGPPSRNTYWLHFCECCQWTAVTSQPPQGLQPCPNLCPFMCDQHPMTDQNETVITWLFLQPMGHCSSRFPVEPTETVMPAFNCTFCLMLLPAFSFHSYWCQRYPLINMPKPKLHLRSVS